MRRMGSLPDGTNVFALHELGGGGVAVLDPPKERARRRAQKPPAPPDAGGGSGDGGGDGEGGAQPSREEPDDPFAHEDPTRAVFALGLVLAGVSTLFCVLLAAWVLMRSRSEGWPPPGAPAPPDSLWISSGLLLASSLALWRGQRSLRNERRRACARDAAISALLGVAFLVAQVLLWRGLATRGLVPSSNGYGTIFYSLTAVHSLHVVVGVLLLVRLALRARARVPAGALAISATVAAIYWHFLGILWLVLFVLLYFVR